MKKQRKPEIANNDQAQKEVSQPVNEELELYSKDGLGIEEPKLEEQLKESGKLKKSGQIDRSLNQSVRSARNNEISIDERI